ncbi:MAG: terpene cyclase/mutase family protein, partial [Methyloprofundus sp.]|nr:terpene cyclase/mutase family protein [Methyloprofundus sp.]
MVIAAVWLKNWGVIIGLSAFILCSYSGLVQADGVSWLETQSTAKEGYTNISDIATASQSTSEVLRTYQLLEQTTQEGVSNARLFLESQDKLHLENVVRAIINLAEFGEPTDVLLAQLLTFQAQDGGFAEQVGYQSTVIDTALALEALAIAQSNASDLIQQALHFLLNQQRQEGGFAHSGANQSSIHISAIASIALQQFRFKYNLSAVIDNTNQYLLKQQLSDGSWGSTWETAFALLALSPVSSDIQKQQVATDYLKNTQDADGSWGQDVYASALALRALHKIDDIPTVISEPTELGTYIGQVVDAENAQPIAGAVIKLLDVAESDVISAQDGSFSMT